MPNADTSRTIDARTFWQAGAMRAVGVAVVTARSAAGPAGFLALSATHLSADPPLMTVSIGKTTSALATVREAGHFAINYLARGDGEIADAFGGKGTLQGADRFALGEWTALATGAPVLATGVGAMDCRLVDIIEQEAAVIAIGRLVDFVSDLGRQPLLSFGGKIG